MALDSTNMRDRFPSEPNREQIIRVIKSTKSEIIDHFKLDASSEASLDPGKHDLSSYMRALDCVHTQVIPQLQKWFPQYAELIQESLSQWIPPPTAAELL